MATSNFYHDCYYRRLRSIYANNAVDDFRCVVCSIFVVIRHLVARSHCRNSGAIQGCRQKFGERGRDKNSCLQIS